MNCDQASNTLNDYLDNALNQLQRDAFIRHLDACVDCRKHMQPALHLQRALRELPVPAARQDLLESALFKVSQSQTHFWPRAIGGALAAGLGLVLALNLWLLPAMDASQDRLNKNSVVQIALYETRQLKLVFNAERALQDAQMTLHLPAHVELAGYQGQRSLSWRTALKQGENLLVLPIKALSLGEGVLTAELEHHGKKELFTVDMKSRENLHQSLDVNRSLKTA